MFGGNFDASCKTVNVLLRGVLLLCDGYFIMIYFEVWNDGEGEFGRNVEKGRN